MTSLKIGFIFRILPVMMFVCIIIGGFPAYPQLAEGHNKFLGCCVGGEIPDTFEDYWNQVTPENASKWGSVEWSRDVCNWNNLDEIYEFAEDYDFPIRFHVLIWGKQQPAWIDALSIEEQAEEVEEWIEEAGDMYPDAEYVEVVNEAIEWSPWDYYPSYYEALGGEGDTGWDWVIWAFEKAREYFPDSKLYLNEYQLFGGNKSLKKYLDIVESLKERDLIDGVCEQGHFIENTSTTRLQYVLDELATTGLPIQITEFDLNIADDQKQLEKYQEVFPILWEHPAVEGITLWGYIQGQMWREDGYLLRADGTERPALEWLRDYLADTKVKNQAGSPAQFELYPNYPNPFNHQSIIRYRLGAETPVRIRVFDIQGREVASLIDERQGAGMHHVQFDAGQLPSGIYLAKLQAGFYTAGRKMMLVK
ncbi:endo-1,4-beta-xylanase [bacterium]|nr:endo-1,4-beta-xylanase [bacterium]